MQRPSRHTLPWPNCRAQSSLHAQVRVASSEAVAAGSSGDAGAGTVPSTRASKNAAARGGTDFLLELEDDNAAQHIGS